MPNKDHVNVALIGQGFMGRTHSNAWGQVAKFFKPPLKPVMHAVYGQQAEDPAAYAAKWGWKSHSTDWEALVRNADVDLVDVVTPNYMHAPVAMAAIAAGKAVSCEKPIAGTIEEARKMVQAAKKAKVKTFVWYNYRRCPAVATAYQLVRDGKIGQIRHVRAYYLQDWADESVPLVWRFDKKLAGSGALGDLAAHIIDMTRFVTGEEIVSVEGAIMETFIKERTLMKGVAAGGIAAGVGADASKKGKVTVDDAALFLARFAGGAVAQFEATRMATGNQNKNGFEINGTKGSLVFNFEDMNKLFYCDGAADRKTRGWTTIMCTHGGSHPYTDAWWPDAHIIGYEHGFTNQCYDILRALAGQEPTVPLPDFADAYKTQQVMEAAERSCVERRPVKISDIE